MSEFETSQAGALETPEDAGEGQPGVVARWTLEIDQASKREEAWRKSADAAEKRFRDESEKDDKPGKRGAGNSRFNILWANTTLLKGALYAQQPRPDVRRRFKDKEPIAKQVAELLERGLSAALDAYDFDNTMSLSVMDYLLPGRGTARVRYLPYFEGEGDDETKKFEEVKCEHWPWKRLRLGPAGKWEDLPWLAFEHILTRDELKKLSPAHGDEVELDVSQDDSANDTNSAPSTHGDIFNRGRVWEIWHKAERKVIYIAPSFADAPILEKPDPLNLENFWPIPRPLYSVQTSGSLVPIEEYRLYRDQAEELDRITRRIQKVVQGLILRGVYDSTVAEIEQVMKGDDNSLIPSEGATAYMSMPGGLDKAVWMIPIERAAQVLVSLYQQREQIKQVIYELTGISDILRGSTDPNETLGAQKIKAQSGGLRLQDRQREVQRYARDLIRLKAEIMAEQFSPETWQVMTGLEATPEMLALMREDGPRGFRVDIETDSTIAVDQQAEQESITALLDGMARFVAAMGPGVQTGVIPAKLVAKLLLPAIRRFRLGREVEDEIESLIGDDDEPGEENMIKLSPEQAQEMQQQVQAQAMEQAQAQAEEAVKGDRAQVDAGRKLLQAEVKAAQADMAIREGKVQIAEQQLGMAGQKVELDSQGAEARLEKRAVELGIQRAQTDMAGNTLDQRVAANEADEGDLVETKEALEAMTATMGQMVELIAAQAEQNAQAQQSMLAALSAPKELVRDEQGRPVGVRTRLDG